MSKSTKDSDRATTERAADAARSAVDKAAESAGAAEEKVRAAAEQLATRPQEVLEAVSHYVRENPMTALGLAFAAGTLFSALNRR